MVYVEDTNKVVFQGLDGYIASEKNGYILICQRSEEQRIKEYKGYDRSVSYTHLDVYKRQLYNCLLINRRLLEYMKILFYYLLYLIFLISSILYGSLYIGPVTPRQIMSVVCLLYTSRCV